MANRVVRVVLGSGLALVALWAGGLRAGDENPSSTHRRSESRKPLSLLAKTGDADKVNAINEKIAAKWEESKEHNIAPSPWASDYEFIRRASLDIIGRIATPREIAQFMKDPADSRRALLIERLLTQKDEDGHIEYAKNFANIWTVWLMTRSGATNEIQGVYHEQMHKWLEEQFAKENASFREIVTELITATGKTNENGAVNYILAHLGEPTPAGKEIEEGKFNMVPVTSRTTRLFLGVQTQCAQCHAHPFNKEWTQNHFWGINAFFRQVDLPRGRAMMVNNNRMQGPPVLELLDNPQLNPEGIILYENLRNGLLLPTKAEFLIEGKENKLRPTSGVNRRQELARFITNSKLFPRAYVNRMWAHFFGRGFTNPVDDMVPENEPTHPELLDELAEAFAHYNYDPRRLIRWICNSDPYRLSSVANKSNDSAEAEPYFSRMLLKAMTPEQLLDSLIVATQAERFESDGNRKRLRVITLAEQAESKRDREKFRKAWMKQLTSNFGDDEGNEVTFNGTVVQALEMMNGSDLNKAIASPDRGTVYTALILSNRNPAGTIDYLYKATLNRPPTSKESEKIMRILRTAPVKSRDTLSFWQDLFWALLNSNEFMLNH